MCKSSCGGLFREGVKLSEVTCPCNRGYWDIWKLTFIDGDMIDGGHPPREAYLKEVKKRLSPEKYESRIRVQGFIRHFLTCPVKSALDKKATREGRNDGSSLRKALTEWREFQEGDYKSHGTSRVLDADTLAGILESIQGHRVSPEDFKLLAGTQSSSDGQRSPSNRYDTPQSTNNLPETKSSRHAASSNRTLVTGDRAERSSSNPGFLIPEAGLRLDVLNEHCRLGTFGPGAAVRAGNFPDGRKGFLIKGNKKPTEDTIRMLLLESKKWPAATEDRRKIETRTFEDDIHGSVTSRHESSGTTVQTSSRSFPDSRSGPSDRNAHEVTRSASDARQSLDARQYTIDRQIPETRYASNARHTLDTPYDSEPRYTSYSRHGAVALARDMGIMKLDSRGDRDFTYAEPEEDPRSLNKSSRASKTDHESETLTRGSNLDADSSARRTWSLDDAPRRREGSDYAPVQSSGDRGHTENTHARQRDLEEDSEMRRRRIDRHGSSISDRREDKGRDQRKGRHR